MSPPSTNKERSRMSKEFSRLLECIVCEIPEKYRIVFALVELNRLSVYETALSLNISESTVIFRLNRAKLLLQKKLKDLYSPDTIFEFDNGHCEKMVKRVMDKIAELDNC